MHLYRKQDFQGSLVAWSVQAWHQIQAEKKDKRDLHVIFLDLANTYGLVPHQLIWESNFFQVPEPITMLV